MEYEFKVGDYVETCSGEVGYIQEVSNNILNIVYNNDKEIKTVVDGEYTIYNQINFKKYYKRIGKYDFTKKEKIELLNDMEFIGYDNKILDCKMNQRNVIEMWDKINEIIEYINKEN